MRLGLPGSAWRAKFYAWFARCRRNFFWHARAANVREILHTPEAVASPAAGGSPPGALELPDKMFEFHVAT